MFDCPLLQSKFLFQPRCQFLGSILPMPFVNGVFKSMNDEHDCFEDSENVLATLRVNLKDHLNYNLKYYLTYYLRFQTLLTNSSVRPLTNHRNLQAL